MYINNLINSRKQCNEKFNKEIENTFKKKNQTNSSAEKI